MSLGNKEVMARNIKRLMEIKGVNQTEMCKDLGFKFMTLSDWLHAKTYPRIDKIEIMARYFGVSKAELVEDVPNIGQQTGYYFDEETAKLAQELKDNPELRILLDAGRDMTPGEMRALINLVKTWKGE